uniref:Uncharacterized protein n=1 Tax=Arundo donax TaxID=35708 RepID=A0A0A8Y169_ARUDO
MMLVKLLKTLLVMVRTSRLLRDCINQCVAVSISLL